MDRVERLMHIKAHLDEDCRQIPFSPQAPVINPKDNSLSFQHQNDADEAVAKIEGPLVPDTQSFESPSLTKSLPALQWKTMKSLSTSKALPQYPTNIMILRQSPFMLLRVILLTYSKAKHVRLSQFAKHSTKSTRWAMVLRHDYISNVWIRKQDPTYCSYS